MRSDSDSSSGFLRGACTGILVCFSAGVAGYYFLSASSAKSRAKVAGEENGESETFHRSTKVDNVINLIGKTPLVHIKSLSEDTGCQIYGKAEFVNPGGSIKDRVALQVIRRRRSKMTSN